MMSQLFRQLTDRRVYCQKCSEPLGYVWLFGHKRWEHVDCPTYSPVRAV
jgi:hypothetical protein